MNRILDKIITARNGHYCHCVEVETTYDLENIAESIVMEFQNNHYENEIIDFLETLEVYCLNDENEKEVFEFSFTEYVKDTL